jgi:hypothetical protein
VRFDPPHEESSSASSAHHQRKRTLRRRRVIDPARGVLAQPTLPIDASLSGPNSNCTL